MAFDLFSQESDERLGAMPRVKAPEPGAFDGFLRGTGRVFMQGMAETGRAASLAVSTVPVMLDKLGASALSPRDTSTTLSDKYFKFHDDVFGRAADYWTPKPGEVGAAAQIAGQLLSTLPLVIASPAAAVAKTQLTTGEDLVRKGVDSTRAQAVGAVQGAGLGLGVWLPILGTNGWQRVIVGGAAANVAQGVATRGTSGAILEGTPAADEFKAFDPTSITLDTLLGVAFGGLAHLSPAQRAQGAAMWERIDGWLKGAQQTDIDALATLRQAQHLNVDSAPGKLETPQDIEKHVTAVRKALDDLVNDRPVDVEQIVSGLKVLPDAQRQELQARVVDEFAAQAQRIVHEDLARMSARDAAADVPAFLRTAEEKLALRDPADKAVHPDIARAFEIARKPGFERTATEKLYLDSVLAGRLGRNSLPDRAKAQAPESLLPEAAGVDPLQAEAARFSAANPDLELTVGRDADGTPQKMKLQQYLDDVDATVARAQDDAKLFQVAAACLLGAA